MFFFPVKQILYYLKSHIKLKRSGKYPVRSEINTVTPRIKNSIGGWQGTHENKGM